MGLVQGRTYIGQVLAIEENADRFNKSTGGTSYCHKVTILLDATAETEVVQICTDYPKVDQFGVNDFIRFKAHKQGKGEWTVHFEEKVYKKQPSPISTPAYVNTVKNEYVGSGNPVVIGTVIDRAFAHTAHFLQMRGNVSDDQFIELAKRVADEMIKYSEEKLPF